MSTSTSTNRRKPQTWFEHLFGALETPATIKTLFTQSIDANGNVCITSSANKRIFIAGKFTTPSLAAIRTDALVFLQSPCQYQQSLSQSPAKITVTHKAIDDILACHHIDFDPTVATTFQAASQFNCLEFPESECTPDQGITNYIYDNTQGPACAVACAAGTIFRNYFAQTTACQINTLDATEKLLSRPFWNVQNGYIFSTVNHLTQLTRLLKTTPKLVPAIRDSIKVGIQSNTEVLMKNRTEPLDKDKPLPRVTQVYCSAVSCSYSGIQTSHWASFAKIVLDAAYESTLWAALLSPTPPASGHYKVYLTFIGGGAFGNDMDWILQSIARAIRVVNTAFKNAQRGGIQLDIIICHYRAINPEYVAKLTKLLTT